MIAGGMLLAMRLILILTLTIAGACGGDGGGRADHDVPLDAAADSSGAEQAVWPAATYSDEYARDGDGWLIARTGIDVAFFTPFDEGWAEQRFLPGRAP